MRQTPTISVVIPCYNCAAFVGDALTSLQAQTFTDWEAILVDDGSTDSTREIIASWADRDKRMRFITQKNQGLAKARNVGILNSSGTFIHFLDADDWMLNDAYTKMATSLRSEPNVAGVYCGMTVTTENGAVTAKYEQPLEHLITFEKVALDNPFPVHSVLIRRDVLNTVGIFDETLRHCHDWDLWGRVFRCGFRLVPVPGPFAVYRMVRTSLSTKHSTFWQAGLEVLRRLYNTDSRCTACSVEWVDGANIQTYPTALRTFALYCLPKAILSGDATTVEEILKSLRPIRNALPSVHETSDALVRGLVTWNPEGPENLPVVWQARRDLVMYALTELANVLIERTYVSDVLLHFLQSVRGSIGTAKTLAICRTVPEHLPSIAAKLIKHRARHLFHSAKKTQ